jgi:hypothetical protein
MVQFDVQVLDIDTPRQILGVFYIKQDQSRGVVYSELLRIYFAARGDYTPNSMLACGLSLAHQIVSIMRWTESISYSLAYTFLTLIITVVYVYLQYDYENPKS